LESIEQAADVVYKQFYVLNMSSGILIGNPPADSPDSQLIEDSIQTALTDARDQQIPPSGLTEFLTTALPTYCENKSQAAFLKNLESNIKLGVKISQTVQKTIQSNFEALQKKKHPSLHLQRHSRQQNSVKNFYFSFFP
jgi:pseudouridine-5'-phosphate glycosidase